MRKFLFVALAGFLSINSQAQSVGIGTTTPRKAAKLHIIGDNADSSFGAYIDGNVLGTGLQVIRGGVGIGPFRPSSRLFVATDTIGTGIDGFPAIVGYAQSDTAAYYGGVYGYYDTNLYGVGVQGIGYNGLDYLSLFGYDNFDVGVHGSATIGVSALGNLYGMYSIVADLNDVEGPPNEQYGIYASSEFGSAATKYAGYFDGDVTITGDLSKGSGTFKIDDPLDPANKYLYHSFVESPDMMNIYNGNITTDSKGMAVVTLPNYFDALNKDFRYQLTTIGSFSQAIIKEEVSGNHFTIQTSQANTKVSWQVTGVRKDKYAEAHRVKAEVDKEPWNRGLYLHAKEFGMDKSKSIPFKASHEMAPGTGISGARMAVPKTKTKEPTHQQLNKLSGLIKVE